MPALPLSPCFITTKRVACLMLSPLDHNFWRLLLPHPTGSLDYRTCHRSALAIDLARYFFEILQSCSSQIVAVGVCGSVLTEQTTGGSY